jgi:transcriptional/translational regulatory protein YebC/TACO1
MIPKNPMKVDSKHAPSMLRLIDAIEDHDDVQNLYSNADFDEADLGE